MTRLLQKHVWQFITLFALVSAFAAPTLAQDCSITIDSTDAMNLSVDTIKVAGSCSEYTVNLTHSGNLPKTAMGHNWVLTKVEDVKPVAQDGISAGLGNDYVKPGDQRVIAFTNIIGGGEKTSVTFAVNKLKAGTNYMFFCSFPGHSFVMQGELLLEG